MQSSGVAVDELRAKELAAPGSDQRFGVNLICRPPREFSQQIAAVQHRLRAVEPAQYYYPPADLHLTLFEICHSLTEPEAAAIADAARRPLSSFLAEARPAALDCPIVVAGSRAAAVRFRPVDAQLERLRAALRDHLSAHGVPPAPRYEPRSAHVTFLRYLAPLETGAALWHEWLATPSIQLHAPWILDSAWLTWGATWYGMRGRMSSFGPIPVGTALSRA